MAIQYTHEFYIIFIENGKESLIKQYLSFSCAFCFDMFLFNLFFNGDPDPLHLIFPTHYWVMRQSFKNTVMSVLLFMTRADFVLSDPFKFMRHEGGLPGIFS